jgi:hypothetical protein
MALKHQNEAANELALRYGSISVGSLRKLYGSFAPHCADDEKLSEVLADLDGASLTQLIRDYKRGRLEKICQPHSRPKREGHGNASNNSDKGL